MGNHITECGTCRKTRSLDYNCQLHGCAKIKIEPNLHEFDDCFGDKICMGDIDGAVERNGHVLFCEFKKTGVDFGFAQTELHRRLSLNSPNQISCFVNLNPMTMEVQRLKWISRGVVGTWSKCDLDTLKRYFSRWYAMADASQRGAA